jgi:RHS repeat-associated protein
VISNDGSAPNEYDVTGQPFSGNPVHRNYAYRGELSISGLVHLRARDYDPTTGTFLTRDPLDGLDGTPTVGNPYPYADNDPLNRVDPRGERAHDAHFLNAGFQGCDSYSDTECEARPRVDPGEETDAVIDSLNDWMRDRVGIGPNKNVQDWFPQLWRDNDPLQELHEPDCDEWDDGLAEDVNMDAAERAIKHVRQSDYPLPNSGRPIGTIAVAFWCLKNYGQSQYGTAIATNGYRSNPGSFSQGSWNNSFYYDMASERFHAETNILGQLEDSGLLLPKTSSLSRGTSGYIIMFVNREPCFDCRRAFLRFDMIYPQVRLIVQYSDGAYWRTAHYSA